MATYVNSVNVMVDGELVETVDPVDITKVIYSLPHRDAAVLENRIATRNRNLSFKFGVIDVKCPYCKQHTDVVHIELRQILFHRYRKVLETIVE
ncbi:hypothetical protein D3C79_989680 [compost metagenome]